MSWFIIITLIAIWWIIAATVLSGQDLRQFDTEVGEHFDDHPEDAEATQRLLNSLKAVRKEAVASKSLKGGMTIVRDFADNLSADLETDSEFTQVDIFGVAAEWTVAKGADSRRRILFFHGGAFLFGSPKGHRKMTDQLSKITNSAVLSVDYRLLPENGRKKSIIDAQHAYHWVISNGPEGKAPVDFLLVSGDSAGGNLSLMISSWSKRNASRQADGIVVFSPSADMTMVSPSIRDNQKTDKILGEGLGLISKLPRPFRAWIGLASMRINPANELASPVFADLANLAPTLIHASSNEMLLGDSIRYTNRAHAMGSEVTLQIWKDQVHDWHLFNMGYGSANTAWDEISKFIESLEQKA